MREIRLLLKYIYMNKNIKEFINSNYPNCPSSKKIELEDKMKELYELERKISGVLNDTIGSSISSVIGDEDFNKIKSLRLKLESLHHLSVLADSIKEMIKQEHSDLDTNSLNIFTK